jgi:hypothetical protein
MSCLEAQRMQVVPLTCVNDTFAALRSTTHASPGPVSPGPIRVLADPARPGQVEVVDGFKRLREAREAGVEKIVVLIEPGAPHLTLAQHAAVLILASNAPRRTLTAMDEVRVVADLVDQQEMTPYQVGKVLGHGKAWVAKRLKVAHRLPAELCRRLEAGSLRLSVAYELTNLPRGDQVRLADGMQQLALGARASLRLVAAYRATEGAEREALLADPASLLERTRPRGRHASPLELRPTVQQRIDACQRLTQQLEALVAAPPLADLTEPELRLLEGERRRLVAALERGARALGGDLRTTTPHPHPTTPVESTPVPPAAASAAATPVSCQPRHQETCHVGTRRSSHREDPAPVARRARQEGDRPPPGHPRQASPAADQGGRRGPPART